MNAGELPLKALSELDGKTAYKLCVSNGVVKIAVDGARRRLK